MPTSGVIEEAVWKRSKYSGFPYIRLKTKVDPFILEGRTIEYVYKGVSPMSFPPTQLERDLDVKIQVPLNMAKVPLIELDTPISELEGLEVDLDISYERYEGLLHPRVLWVRRRALTT